jgi:broad specificity phosphatase PhoE
MRVYTLIFLSTFSLIACRSVKEKEQNVLNAPLEFYFVRHGQTAWGADDILKGPQDLALNDVGIQQAHETGLILKDLLNEFTHTEMVSSSLRRALETAEEIKKATNIPVSSQEDGLQERYYGDYRLTSNIAETPPDAESTEAFKKRVYKSLLKILGKHRNDSPLIIVSHQKVFECIAEFLTDRKEKLSQGGIAHFVLNDKGGWELEIVRAKAADADIYWFQL